MAVRWWVVLAWVGITTGLRQLPSLGGLITYTRHALRPSFCLGLDCMQQAEILHLLSGLITLHIPLQTGARRWVSTNGLVSLGTGNLTAWHIIAVLPCQPAA